jgi:hypothetical protein
MLRRGDWVLGYSEYENPMKLEPLTWAEGR